MLMGEVLRKEVGSKVKMKSTVYFGLMISWVMGNSLDDSFGCLGLCQIKSLLSKTVIFPLMCRTQESCVSLRI